MGESHVSENSWLRARLISLVMGWMSLFPHPRMRMWEFQHPRMSTIRSLKNVSVRNGINISCHFWYFFCAIYENIIQIFSKVSNFCLNKKSLNKKKNHLNFIFLQLYRHPHSHLFGCGCGYEFSVRISADADVRPITNIYWCIEKMW